MIKNFCHDMQTVWTMSPTSKHLALVTLLFGLITISSKHSVEGRSVSGWITANYPDMYNEHVQRTSDRRRLQLLLGILRRKIDLTGAINAAVQQNKSGHIRFIHLTYFIFALRKWDDMSPHETDDYLITSTVCANLSKTKLKVATIRVGS